MTALRFGFHVGPGGNMDGIGKYFRDVNAAGISVFLKSVDNYGPCGELLQVGGQHGVVNTIVYRLSTQGQGDGYDYDVPNYALSPEAAAISHWQATKAKLPPEFDTRVWVEPVNEIDKDRADWLGWFAFHLARLANSQGYRVTMFGWSSGEPEPEHWDTPGMVKYLQYCGENHHLAAVSLHEYSYNQADIKAGYPYLLGRFKRLFETCDRRGIRRPILHMTEWGWEKGKVAPTIEGAIEDIRWAQSLYGAYPEIQAAIWYLGPGFDGIANQAQKLIVPLTALALELGPDADPPPPPPPPPPPTQPPACFDPVKEIVMLVPPDLTLEQRAILTDWSYSGIPGHTKGISARHTFSYSHVTAIRTVLAGLTDSELYIIDGHLIGSGLDEAWLRANCPAILDTRKVVCVNTRPQPPAHIPVPLFSQRDSRWSGVAMGNGLTIGTWGCLLVAYNMLANYWKLCTDTPDKFLTRMKTAGAMTGPYVNAAALRTTFPTKVTYLGYEGRGASLNARIRASVDRGIPIPTRVDFKPTTSQWEQHWVLIVGYTAADFIMADPWHGDVVPVSTRYNISGDDILEGIFYELSAPPPPPPPPPTGNAPMGLHASADPTISPAEIAEFAALKPGVIKVMSIHDPAAIAQLAAAHPAAAFIVRAYISGKESGNPRTISPAQFVTDTINDVRRTLDVLAGREVVVELHNETNLLNEGLGGFWKDGKGYNAWFIEVISQYRVRLPGIKFMFPGLSPGGTVIQDGMLIRLNNQQFALDCAQAIAAADFLGIHAYWNSGDAPLPTALTVVDWYLSQFPNKQAWITEASNNKGAPPDVMAQDYVTFWNEMKRRPRVRGVTYFVASASDPEFRFETWVDKGLGARVRARM